MFAFITITITSLISKCQAELFSFVPRRRRVFCWNAELNWVIRVYKLKSRNKTDSVALNFPCNTGCSLTQSKIRGPYLQYWMSTFVSHSKHSSPSQPRDNTVSESIGKSPVRFSPRASIYGGAILELIYIHTYSRHDCKSNMGGNFLTSYWKKENFRQLVDSDAKGFTCVTLILFWLTLLRRWKKLQPYLVDRCTTTSDRSWLQ